LDIEALLAWDPVPVDASLLRGGCRVRDRLGLSWWDSLIVAGALSCGSEWLLSEDLTDGLTVDGLRVINPFRHSPRQILGR
jgi:predicted nucleic acid-binding protein